MCAFSSHILKIILFVRVVFLFDLFELDVILVCQEVNNRQICESAIYECRQKLSWQFSSTQNLKQTEN